MPKIVDWYMEGRIEIDPLVTHRMPLDDVNRAFALAVTDRTTHGSAPRMSRFAAVSC